MTAKEFLLEQIISNDSLSDVDNMVRIMEEYYDYKLAESLKMFAGTKAEENLKELFNIIFETADLDEETQQIINNEFNKWI